MSDIHEWKHRALELWPDLQNFLDEEDTIYTLFFELLTRCRDAHREGKIHELTKIYSYAEWCLSQPEKDLWNAAGVAFYEHLMDEPDTREAIPIWLSPGVYEQVRGLFRFRMDADEFAQLERAYSERHV